MGQKTITKADLTVETCYACDAQATSREHAPPKAIFPERKDVEDDTDYRKDLITVPACAAHNLKMSDDDQYFMVVSAISCENNGIANKQVSTKISRALEREPRFLGRFSKLVPAVVNGKPSGGVKVDTESLERTIEKIARALYFADHGRSTKLLRRVKVIVTSLRMHDTKPHPLYEELIHLCEVFLVGVPVQGANPEVFRYQMKEEDGSGVLKMVFYDGTHAFTFWGDSVDNSS